MKSQLHLLLIHSEEIRPHGLYTFLGILVIHELSIYLISILPLSVLLIQH